MIPGRGNSGVRLADHPDAGVSRRILIGDDIAPVRCAVVDDQQFEIVVGLVENRLNRLADVRRDVVRRHDYADGWHCADARTLTRDSRVELDQLYSAFTDRSVAPPGAWNRSRAVATRALLRASGSASARPIAVMASSTRSTDSDTDASRLT